MTTEVKAILILLFIVGLIVLGYFLGWKSNHDQIVAMQSVGKAQNVETKKEEKKDDQVTKSVADDFTAERAHYLSVIAGLRRVPPNTCSDELPKEANNTQVHLVSDGERGRTCDVEFYASAIKCEGQLKKVRDWVAGENIPVSPN